MNISKTSVTYSSQAGGQSVEQNIEVLQQTTARAFSVRCPAESAWQRCWVPP